MPDTDRWPTGRLLTTAARLVEHDWNERLASIGVTHAGIIALDVLASRGPMSQATLASWARVQAQTMGKTLSRLELRGHVQRIRSTEDRRSHLVSLTAEGQKVLGQAQEMECGLLDDTGMEDVDLRDMLRQIITNLGKSQLPNADSVRS